MTVEAFVLVGVALSLALLAIESARSRAFYRDIAVERARGDELYRRVSRELAARQAAMDAGYGDRRAARSPSPTRSLTLVNDPPVS